jgi:ABC-type transport system involved in cytochrome c biogenesis permease subunit
VWLVALLAGGCGLLIPGARADAQRGQPAITGGRLLAEVGTGALTTPLGFIGGGIATRWVARKFGASDDAGSTAGLIGGYTIAALATAVPPTLIGQAGRHATGSYLAALAGTAIGGLGSFALIRLNRQRGETSRPCHFVCAVSFAGIVLLPSVGATTGFNLSRRYAR